MIVVDTSVAVAAAAPWHEAHGDVVKTLPAEKTRLVAHVGVETYSVLTRLPPPQRVAPDVARAWLASAFALPALVLPAAGYKQLLDIAAAQAIAGGAAYDALVGLTARHAEATLLTLDHRAVRTYAACGASYRLLT